MRSLLLGLAVVTVCGCECSPGEICRNIIMPEQRTVEYHDPTHLPPADIPENVPPRTVTNPQPEDGEWPLSLDEAIRISLENAKVIRVLAGATAVSSGQTIYDAAITNTTIDQAQARFDPVLSDMNTWSRTNTPTGEINPLNPTESFIGSTPTDAYLSNFGLSKTNVLGGTWQLNWTENPTRVSGILLVPFDPANPSAGSISSVPLNPQNPTAVTLTYTQPLLQGAGFQVNTAPIVIARLNTETSYFQYKDSVEEMVRSVIQAYWNLVQARTDVWARKIQVEQSKEDFERTEARLKTGLGDSATVAQARVTYYQFRANLVAAEATALTDEDALRNVLGLPPNDGRKIVPVSAPTSQRLHPDWDAVVHLAEERRPDIVELKLITEADRVRLVQAKNQALPQLNAVTSYQWNGLTGIALNGLEVGTRGGQYDNWSVGINFSVPLGLRQGRAGVRQDQLMIMRDQANVDQGVHAAIHQLAGSVRDLDSAYEQYLAFKETREAADANVRAQNEQFKAGRTIYLNVLQALNDWGTAVSSEAQQLLNYNIALATLERQTGTILETHGLVFVEERFQAAGPSMIPGCDRSYPAALVPEGSPQNYPPTGKASENAFDLTNPAPREDTPPEKRDQLPAPREITPPGPKIP